MLCGSTSLLNWSQHNRIDDWAGFAVLQGVGRADEASESSLLLF